MSGFRVEHTLKGKVIGSYPAIVLGEYCPLWTEAYNQAPALSTSYGGWYRIMYCTDTIWKDDATGEERRVWTELKMFNTGASGGFWHCHFAQDTQAALDVWEHEVAPTVGLPKDVANIISRHIIISRYSQDIWMPLCLARLEKERAETLRGVGQKRGRDSNYEFQDYYAKKYKV